MLPKQKRIKRFEFPLLSSKGGSFFSQHLTARARKLPNTEKTLKISVVVSKKVAKSAVLRNTLRRRVYSALENTFKNKGKKPLSIIFYLKKGAEKLTYKEIEKEVQSLVNNIQK